ncbi:hypothetical protein RRF57_010660 [Xylaria bambusicola]|uniref:Uncharacterized protein n=1 Tax=Xylaria bambusicola TaxID=326684 RepID=A0AAN7USS8_9PEZI
MLELVRALGVLRLGGMEIGVEVVGSAAMGLGEAQIAYVYPLEMPQTPILGQHCSYRRVEWPLLRCSYRSAGRGRVILEIMNDTVHEILHANKTATAEPRQVHVCVAVAS